MYSSRIVSFLYIAAVILLATMTQFVSATPIEPGDSPSEVISNDRDMACRYNDCYYRNGTDSKAALASASSEIASSFSTPTPSPLAAASGAISYQPVVMLPAIIAGTSLLLLL